MAGAAGLTAMGSFGSALASRNNEMNILCWEGYNSDEVLGPFRAANPGSNVRAESGTSDPDMINKLRAGEVNVWDLINVNQPWAREQLYPENLIKPLSKEPVHAVFRQDAAGIHGAVPAVFRRRRQPDRHAAALWAVLVCREHRQNQPRHGRGRKAGTCSSIRR